MTDPPRTKESSAARREKTYRGSVAAALRLSLHVSRFAFLWQQHLTFVLFSQSVRPEECLLLISRLLRGLSLGADAPLFPPRLFRLIDALRLKSASRGIASRASFPDARLRPILLKVRLVQSDLAWTARRAKSFGCSKLLPKTVFDDVFSEVLTANPS